MLGEPPTRQARIALWYRGPEWAFAVRDGDLDAVTWVLENVGFWNGANSLIIPVRSDGRTWPMVTDLLAVHPVETCFVHDSVAADTATRVAETLGDRVRQWSPVWDGFDEHEMHPLLLQPEVAAAEDRPALRVPRFGSRRLHRIGLAAWGRLPDDERPAYEARFDLEDAGGIDAHAALLEGQLNQRSPLEQSTKLIEQYGQMVLGRSLFVFTRGSFAEIVHFWNLRSRTRDIGHRQLLIAVTKEAMEDPTALAALPPHIAEDDFLSQEPDLGAVAYKDPALIRSGLGALGFEEHEGNSVSRSIGGGRGSRPLTFGFFHPSLPGPIKRGTLVRDEITITDHRSSFRPARPADLPRTGHYIRVAIENLPLPLPLTDAAAAATTQNAYRSPEGVTIVTNAWIGDGYLDLEIPEGRAALDQWAAAAGETVEISAAGRYGKALLDRLGDYDGLDALATEPAIAILEALAPTSRKKLAQRVVAEARSRAGRRLDEDMLAELLGEKAEYLELQARTAADISGEASVQKKTILGSLAALIASGFVVRGAAARCPTCGFRQVLPLAQQEERVNCGACRAEFLLPVLEEGGQQERLTVYRLDGLMGRAMDQDLLPVLLALRILVRRYGPPRAVWPGLEFTKEDHAVEQDLLTSDGQNVWVVECKARAEGLTDRQARALLGFAADHGVTPVIAALDGTFVASQKTSFTEAGGVVLERKDLLG